MIEDVSWLVYGPMMYAFVREGKWASVCAGVHLVAEVRFIHPMLLNMVRLICSIAMYYQGNY